MRTIDKSIILYLIISCVAIIFNILNLHNVAPWVDEVMIVDTPAQFYLHGEWDSTAYWGGASIYVPLYGILQLLWYYIFGYSLLSARLMNILLYVFVGLSMISLLKKSTGKQLTISATLILSGLLWFTADLAQLYREGRPDILCALITILIFKEAYQYVSDTHNKPYKLIVYGALLFMSGLQACMCVAAMAVFFLLFFWSKKSQIIKAFAFFLCGCFVGLIITSVFMYYTGVFNSFVINTLHESTTLWKLFLLIAPLLTTKQFGDINEVKIDFFEKLTASFSNQLMWILLVSGLLLLWFSLPKGKFKIVALLFLLPIYIVVAMNVSGRYYGPYCWMFFLPLIFSITYMLALLSSWKIHIIGYLTLLVTCVVSLPSFGSINDKAYENMSAFVNKQEFELTDNVATPMALFYELKPHVKNVYFPEICPLKKIPKLDYIIVPIHNERSDRFMRFYSAGLPTMKKCFQDIANDTTIQIIPVDSCSYPSLVIYRIGKN